MARRLRFAPPGYWLHLTQRGNNQQPVFSNVADRRYFLGLLESRSEEREVRIAAYTLMTNHFHIVAAGDQVDASSLFMMDVNGQYAIYRNATQRTTGHLSGNETAGHRPLTRPLTCGSGEWENQIPMSSGGIRRGRAWRRNWNKLCGRLAKACTNRCRWWASGSGGWCAGSTNMSGCRNTGRT